MRDQEVVDWSRGIGRPRREAPVKAGVADPEVLDAVVRSLVEEFQPERIYLFGSRARGDATGESDYDLQVVVEERVGPPFEMERRSRQALRDVRQPIDVVIVTHQHFDWMLGAAASLPATVAREGRLLHAR